MNHLKGQLSPYLEQHVDNPVDWYPWGEEAFNKARTEGKPIFLSIGYSTCHWCHVMAHESFEDEEVAAYLNAHFVSIKVDREERPDIDSLYMGVCQAMTGSGGWPLTILMDGDQDPFFAATYLPKRARYGQMGLLELLERINTLWKEAPQELANQQQAIIDFLNNQSQKQADTARQFDIDFLVTGVQRMADIFDETFGGFGQAPKFPTPHRLSFLQRAGILLNQPHALEMTRETLDGMMRGGFFDHVGGGFARYSTDSRWLVPHFEKMLYDNALLAIVYMRQYQIDGNPLYRYVAEQTLDFMNRELSSEDGGFYSALDADSEGREGAFYVFTKDEIRANLPQDSADRLIEWFQVTEEGNFEGANVLNLLHVDDLAVPNDLIQEDLYALRQVREERIPLHVDDKALLGWNGLAVTAFAIAYEITGSPRFLAIARRARAFIEDKLWQPDGHYAMHYRLGQASGSAQLDDYVFLAWADANLYRATAENADLRSALNILEQIEARFLDDEQGGYFMTARDEAALIIRPKEWHDGAMMCGNSLMVGLLHEAYAYTASLVYRERLDSLLAAYAKRPQLSVLSHGYFYAMLTEVLTPHQELVVRYHEPEDLLPWFAFQSAHPLYQATLLALDKDSAVALADYTDLMDDFPIKEEVLWYLCANHVCQQPRENFDDVAKNLLPLSRQ